jgi:hypothetical protein
MLFACWGLRASSREAFEWQQPMVAAVHLPLFGPSMRMLSSSPYANVVWPANRVVSEAEDAKGSSRLKFPALQKYI